MVKEKLVIQIQNKLSKINKFSKLMTNFNFNFKPKTTTTQQSNGENIYFNPNPKNATDKTYKATVRFMAYPVEPEKYSIFEYITVNVLNPLTQKSVRMPRSVTSKSAISELYKYTKDSKNARVNKFSDSFKPVGRYIAPVYIVDDTTNPKNNGKILLWDFGKKIYEIVTRNIEPTEDDIESGIEQFYPYNPLRSANFIVKGKMVSDYPNYDISSYSKNIGSFLIPGDEEPMSEKDVERYFKFVKANCPDITKFDVTELTDFQKKHLSEVAKLVFEGTNLYAKWCKDWNMPFVEDEEVATTSVDKPKKPQFNISAKPASSVQNEDDEDIFDGI